MASAWAPSSTEAAIGVGSPMTSRADVRGTGGANASRRPGGRTRRRRRRRVPVRSGGRCRPWRRRRARDAAEQANEHEHQAGRSAEGAPVVVASQGSCHDRAGVDKDHAGRRPRPSASISSTRSDTAGADPSATANHAGGHRRSRSTAVSLFTAAQRPRLMCSIGVVQLYLAIRPQVGLNNNAVIYYRKRRVGRHGTERRRQRREQGLSLCVDGSAVRDEMRQYTSAPGGECQRGCRQADHDRPETIELRSASGELTCHRLPK